MRLLKIIFVFIGLKIWELFRIVLVWPVGVITATVGIPMVLGLISYPIWDLVNFMYKLEELNLGTMSFWARCWFEGVETFILLVGAVIVLVILVLLAFEGVPRLLEFIEDNWTKASEIVDRNRK